jgi:hypothetical protein
VETGTNGVGQRFISFKVWKSRLGTERAAGWSDMLSYGDL